MAARHRLGTPSFPANAFESRIFLIRGQKVTLSTHLAELYEVEPRALVQAVKRNVERFPEDFMFQLNDREFASLKSQFVIEVPLAWLPSAMFCTPERAALQDPGRAGAAPPDAGLVRVLGR
jgi:hypothetical protein